MFLKKQEKTYCSVSSTIFLTINGQHPNVLVGEKQYTTGLLANT